MNGYTTRVEICSRILTGKIDWEQTKCALLRGYTNRNEIYAKGLAEQIDLEEIITALEHDRISVQENWCKQIDWVGKQESTRTGALKARGSDKKNFSRSKYMAGQTRRHSNRNTNREEIFTVRISSNEKKYIRGKPILE